MAGVYLGLWQRRAIRFLKERGEGGSNLGDLLAVGGVKGGELEQRRTRESHLASVFGLHDKGLVEEYRVEPENRPPEMWFRLTKEGQSCA